MCHMVMHFRVLSLCRLASAFRQTKHRNASFFYVFVPVLIKQKEGNEYVKNNVFTVTRKLVKLKKGEMIMKKSKGLINCFSAIGIFFVLLLAGCAESMEKEAHDKTIADVKKQYEIAVKGGNKFEIVTNARLVAEAYKQAHDEENYLKWKKIADEAEEAAGLTFPQKR